LGLEKLKSLFNKNVGNAVTDFFQNPPDGFTKNFTGTDESKLALTEPQRMISTFGTIGQNLSQNFGKGFSDFRGQGRYQSELASESLFNENVGNAVTDFFQNPPDGFTKNFTGTDESKLAPTEPQRMISTFGIIGQNLSQNFGIGFSDFRGQGRYQSELASESLIESLYSFSNEPPAVNFMDETDGVTIPGFTTRWERVDDNVGPGNTKYLGLSSKFNNDSILNDEVGDLGSFVNYMNVDYGTLIPGFDKFSTEYGFLENDDIGSSKYFSNGNGDLIQPRSGIDDFNKDPKTNFVNFMTSDIPGFEQFGTTTSEGVFTRIDYSWGDDLGVSKYLGLPDDDGVVDLVTDRSSYYPSSPDFNKDPKTNFVNFMTSAIPGFEQFGTSYSYSADIGASNYIDENPDGVVDLVTDRSSYYGTQDFETTPNKFNILNDVRYEDGISSDGTARGKIGKEGLKFETLYDNDHTVTDAIGQTYKGVARSDLNQQNTALLSGGLFDFSSWRGAEPYIMEDIKTESGLTGRKGGPYGFELAAYQSGKDIIRMTKFLSSPAGLLFIARQNALGLISPRDVRKKAFDSSKQAYGKSDKQRFNEYYLPSSTILSAARLLRAPVPNLGVIGAVFDRNDPVGLTQEDQYITPAGNKDTQYSSFFYKDGLTEISKNNQLGDFFTNLDIGHIEASSGKLDESTIEKTVQVVGQKKHGTTKLLENFPKESDTIESEVHGMPFYFKDLRDNTYVFFRAYLSGITENISPDWNPETYIGRAEPVYTYLKTDRDISFNLTLAANTRNELDKIYQKMNRLTSMCYPQYKHDPLFGTVISRARSKPPLTRFRLGEMYGDASMGLLGFMKSVTYTVADNSTWEHEQGYRVPKIVEVAVNYQVIHDESPGINNDGIPTRFYGIYKQYEASSVTREYVNG